MKKLLPVALLLNFLFASFPSMAQLGTYAFEKHEASNGTTTLPEDSPTATGVSFGQFTAVGLSASTSFAGRFSYTNWGTGAPAGQNDYTKYTGSLNTQKYFEVTVAPQTGYKLSLSSIAFTIHRSASGSRQWAVRSSLDGYAANLPASVSPANSNIQVLPGNVFFQTLDNSTLYQGSTITLGSSFTNRTSPVTFRFYSWNAEGTGGAWGIDDVTFYGTGTLPITLKSFSASASGSTVLLKWATQSESDNKEFVIERTADGKTFETVTTVAGAGTSTAPRNYSTNDFTPYAGTSYYRLKQVDFNGEFSTSDLVKVNILRAEDNIFTVYPNPFTSQVAVKLATDNRALMLQLFDSRGSLVLRLAGSLTTLNTKLADLSGLASGIYILQLADGDKVYESKIVKH